MATAVVLVGGGAIFWYSCWQEIPYTHRVHTVFTTDKFDRSIGESQFRQVTERVFHALGASELSGFSLAALCVCSSHRH